MEHRCFDSNLCRPARGVLLVASLALPWAAGCQINFDDLNADGEVNTGDIGNNQGDGDGALPAGSEGGPCYGNGTCDEDLVCRAEVCVDSAADDEGRDDEPDGGGGESASPCVSDAACVSGEYCNTTAGSCAPGCRSELSCGEDETCNAAHRCEAADAGGGTDGGVNDGEEPECTSDASCAPNEYCDVSARACRVGCRSDLSCGAGQTCNTFHRCEGASTPISSEEDVFVSNGPPVRVNSFSLGKQYAPAIAALADGRFVVTWMSFQEVNQEFDIYFQLYTSRGEPVGPERRANSFTGGPQMFPAVAGLASGGFVIAWSSWAESGQGTWSLRVQRFRADGTAAGAPLRASDHIPGHPHDLLGGPYVYGVTALRDSGFAVGWIEDRPDEQDVFMVQRFEDGGLAAEAPVEVTTPTAFEETWTVALAPVSETQLFVAWTQRSLIGLVSEIYVGTVGVALEQSVRLQLTGDNHSPLIAVHNESEDVYIAWQGGDGDNWGANGMLISRDLQALSPQTVVNSYTFINQLLPGIAAIPGGEYVGVWYSHGAAYELQDVRARRLDAQGNPLRTDLPVDMPEEDVPTYTRVAALSDGSIVFVWSTRDGDSANLGYGVTPHDIMMRRYVRLSRLRPDMNANLTFNGDFGLGDVDFSSELPLTQTPEAGVSGYAVASAAIGSCIVEDHSDGGGMMLVAETAGSSSGTAVWSQQITVSEGTDYEFAGWIATWGGAPAASLVVTINGQQSPAPIEPSAECGAWARFAVRWSSGTQTQANVSIEVASTGEGRFALDDLVLGSLNGAL